MALPTATQGELMTENAPKPASNMVGALLDAAGLCPSAEEVRALEKAYPQVRSMIDALYAVSEARYEVPAVHFAPRPVFSPWAPDPERTSTDG